MLFAFLGLATVLIIASLWGRFEVSKFLQTHAAIDSDASLSAFKTLVRRNMLVAIAGLAVGLLFGLSSAMLTFQMGLIGLLVVLAVAIPLFLLGRSSKKLEMRARNLPCSVVQLEPEYRRVGQSWHSKMLPDF
jgi:ABC-type multidrug transport system fused ATPase/permease subunit